LKPIEKLETGAITLYTRKESGVNALTNRAFPSFASLEKYVANAWRKDGASSLNFSWSIFRKFNFLVFAQLITFSLYT